MAGWVPCEVEGRIAGTLESRPVRVVREFFSYGVRILCPITLRAGRDAVGWSSWREIAAMVGAEFPPRHGLTAMIDSGSLPHLATNVDRLVGCSARPAIAIARRHARTTRDQRWKAAIWTVWGDPIGEPADQRIITIVDDSAYGSTYDYQLVAAFTETLTDPFLYPEPSFLWSDDETLFLEVQPETGWLEVYSTSPDLVDWIRRETEWEVVPLVRDL